MIELYFLLAGIFGQTIRAITHLIKTNRTKNYRELENFRFFIPLIFSGAVGIGSISLLETFTLATSLAITCGLGFIACEILDNVGDILSKDG